MQLPMLVEGKPAARGLVHVCLGDWREQRPSWPRRFVYVFDPPYGTSVALGNTRGDEDTRGLALTIEGDEDTRERDAALAVKGWSAAAVFGPGDILGGLGGRG